MTGRREETRTSVIAFPDRQINNNFASDRWNPPKKATNPNPTARLLTLLEPWQAIFMY